MTKWYRLHVPRGEGRAAQALGAEFCSDTKTWMCSKGRFQSSAFKRWRSLDCWRTHVVFVEFEERGHAKQYGCRWSTERRLWFYDTTQEPAKLPLWVREHLTLRAKEVYRVPYEQRDLAKKQGGHWDAARRAWALPPGVFPCETLRNYRVMVAGDALQAKPCGLDASVSVNATS